MPSPEFPAGGVVVDTSALIRLYKCNALEKLRKLTKLHLTPQVCREFDKEPQQRNLLRTLQVVRHSMTPGSVAFAKLCQLRGGRFSPKDLGEDESLALCLVEAEQGRLLPLVTFDDGAARAATAQGVPTVDFLSLLAWCVARGVLSYEEADALEVLAAQRNGWKRPRLYTGRLEPVAEDLRQATVHAVQAWRLRLQARGNHAKGRSHRRK